MLSTHASPMTVATEQRPEAKQKKAKTAEECSSTRFADMSEGELAALAVARANSISTHPPCCCEWLDTPH